MTPEQWTATFGPFDDDGKPIPFEDLPDPGAARRPPGARAASHPFGERHEHEIEASAMPIVASEAGASGAMILFWPLNAKDGEEAQR